jgi:hypothetical protein
MDSVYHNICFFWQPRYSPLVPPSTDSVRIVPVKRSWNSLSYPSLQTAIPLSNSISPQNILGLQFALNGIVTSAGKAYILCRNLFLILSVFCLVDGILNLLLANGFGIIQLVMCLFWICVTRMMANRLMIALGETEVVMEAKMADLTRAYLGNEVMVRAGSCMQWVSVSEQRYIPPQIQVAQGVPVPMGLPV